MKNLFSSGWSVVAKGAAIGAAAFRGVSAIELGKQPSLLLPFVSAADLPPVHMRAPARGQKNITLRVHPKTGAVELRAPRRTSRAQISAFLQEQQPWLAERLAELAPAVPLQAGRTIPYLGQARLVRADPSHKRGVRDSGTELLVGVGDALGANGFDSALAEQLVARRLRTFLMAQAKREVVMRSHYYAACVGKKVGQISVRDMHARWGSCAQNTRGTAPARLAFSWRLILAPLFVLDYVVAHECAHLRHMDHSPAFWALVNELVGDYTSAEDWLSHHGPAVLRVG